MPQNDNQNIEKLLDKEGLKVAQVQGGKKVVIPKGVRTDPKKFDKAYGKIQASMAMHGNSSDVDANEFLNLFSYYIKNVLESKVSARMERYKQMDFIMENDGALSLAKRVLRDEILQADVFDQPITVTARNVKFKKAIMKLFNDLGVKDLLSETGENLIKYGDGFWILDTQKGEGVQKVIPVDPHDVKHRFEFSIAELKAQKLKLKRQFNGLQTIIELGSNLSSNAVQFNKVLLGFQILNTIFPFWQVLHFRQFTTKKSVAPFGKPTFYEAQSEARMYLNSKVIVSMVRSSAFVREHVKIRTQDDMDPMEQWELVQQIKQMMELFIDKSGKTNKDVPSFGQRIYYPENLLEIEPRESGINFRDRFEDLKLEREDVFTATGMPKGYFVGEGGQYVPIKALMQQDKKTARMVFDLQNITIAQLIKLVETHFTLTGEFDPYAEEFAISLPYPIPDIDDSMIGISQAKMQYATSTIDGLKATLNISKIPETVVRDILVKYFPFEDDDINSILLQMRKEAGEEEELGIEPVAAKYGDPYMMGKVQKDQMQQMDQGGTEPMQMPQKQKPGQPSQEKKKDVRDLPPEELVQMSGSELQQAGLSPDEIAVISKQKKQMAAQHIRKQNELYEKEYKDAIAKKPLKEAVHEVLDNMLLSRDSSEFVTMNRHYVTSKYVSQDHNNKAIVDFKKPDLKKVLNESKSKNYTSAKTLRGIAELHDEIVDQRYLNKQEKRQGTVIL